MLKTIILNAFKILLAAGLIYWLISSGKLDFRLLTQLVHHPLAVLIAVILQVTNFLLTSYRWETILRARSQVKIPLLGLFKITWIGQFFSSVLPGSVSGDLVKMLYIQKFDSSFSKKFIFASILIDRLMGLAGLILLVGISSILFGGHILEDAPAMKPLLNMNYLLSLLVLTSIFVFVFFNHVIRHFLVLMEQKFLGHMFQKMIMLWDDLVMIRTHMLKAVALSILVQFIGVCVFWVLIFPFVAGHMDFLKALAFIPLGLMTLTLPVAPSGLGVGHAIFQKLFEFAGISNGASLFNLYFFLTLAVNVFGVIPYIMTKMKKD